MGKDRINVNPPPTYARPTAPCPPPPPGRGGDELLTELVHTQQLLVEFATLAAQLQRILLAQQEVWGSVHGHPEVPGWLKQLAAEAIQILNEVTQLALKPSTDQLHTLKDLRKAHLMAQRRLGDILKHLNPKAPQKGLMTLHETISYIETALKLKPKL